MHPKKSVASRAPAPKNRAVLDSLLYSLAEELVPAATCATFATASEGVGDMVAAKERLCNQEGPGKQTRDTTNGYQCAGIGRRGD